MKPPTPENAAQCLVLGLGESDDINSREPSDGLLRSLAVILVLVLVAEVVFGRFPKEWPLR